MSFLRGLPWKRGLLLAVGVHVIAFLFGTILMDVSGLTGRNKALFVLLPLGVAEFPAVVISAAVLFSLKSLKYVLPQLDGDIRFYTSLMIAGGVHAFVVALQYAFIVQWFDRMRIKAGTSTGETRSVPPPEDSGRIPPSERLVYEKPWVVICALIFFWPGGLAFMWKGRVWTHHVRVFVTIIVALLAVLTLVTMIKGGGRPDARG